MPVMFSGCFVNLLNASTFILIIFVYKLKVFVNAGRENFTLSTSPQSKIFVCCHWQAICNINAKCFKFMQVTSFFEKLIAILIDRTL